MKVVEVFVSLLESDKKEWLLDCRVGRLYGDTAYQVIGAVAKAV